MPAYIAPGLKFVGTISLGLLTGVSYTTTTTSIPALFTFPTASAAASTYQAHQASALSQIFSLTTLTASAYTLAYLLSPHGAKHPYLIWTALLASTGAGVDFWLTRKWEREEGGKMGGNGKGKLVEEEEDFEDVHASSASVKLNGEEVRRSIEAWRGREIIRGCISGLAFAMSLVGLWGDGVRDGSLPG